MDGAEENAATGRAGGERGTAVRRLERRRAKRKSPVWRGLEVASLLALVAMLIVPNIAVTAKGWFPFAVEGYEREVLDDTVVRYPTLSSGLGGELPQVPMAQVRLPVQERIRLARTLLMKLGFHKAPVCTKGKGAVWECFECELTPGRPLHADLEVSTRKESPSFSVGFKYDWFSLSGRGSLRQEEADAKMIMVLYARTYHALLHGGTLEKPQKSGTEGVHYCSFGFGACNDRVHLDYWIPCPKDPDSGGCDAP